MTTESQQETSKIKVKYFTKDTINRLNKSADLRDGLMFPVYKHEAVDDRVRVDVVVNGIGDTISVDLSYEEWETLPYKSIDKPY